MNVTPHGFELAFFFTNQPSTSCIAFASNVSATISTQ